MNLSGADLDCSPLSAADVLANAQVVSLVATSEAESFTRALGLLQPRPYEASASEGPARIWSGFMDAYAAPLRDLMGGQGPVAADCAFSLSERALLEEVFDGARDLYSQTFPAHFRAYEQLTTHVLFARKRGFGGGSVSNRVGMIWLAPEPTWGKAQLAEALFHEFLHQCLFLDEMVNTIFAAPSTVLETGEAVAQSAIRQERRGYDKAYHSAFVAYGVCRFQMRLGNNTHAFDQLPPLLVCVDELLERRRFLTPNGLARLEQLIERVLTLREELTNVVADPRALRDAVVNG